MLYITTLFEIQNTMDQGSIFFFVFSIYYLLFIYKTQVEANHRRLLAGNVGYTIICLNYASFQ